MNKILLSGVKPSGELHIGNYFGAVKQFVELQDEYKCFFFIPDLHAMNTQKNPKDMQESIINIVLDYLAVGIDPKKSVIFQQSQIPAHTEATWIFDTLVTMPYLMRAHAFKDAEAKNKDILVGTFNYPVLMAADILLYDTDVVPVGQDQKQHIEIARDIAQKFNNTYNTNLFKEPKEYIIDNVAIVPGTDGQKMSKSYNNTIPLFADKETIKKKVMSIITDSGEGEPVNVKAIHLLVKDKDYVEKLYEGNKGQYKILKEALIEDLNAFIGPMREKRAQLEKNKEEIIKIINEGTIKAKEIADTKLLKMREVTGLLLV